MSLLFKVISSKFRCFKGSLIYVYFCFVVVVVLWSLILTNLTVRKEKIKGHRYTFIRNQKYDRLCFSCLEEKDLCLRTNYLNLDRNGVHVSQILTN